LRCAGVVEGLHGSDCRKSLKTLAPPTETSPPTTAISQCASPQPAAPSRSTASPMQCARTRERPWDSLHNPRVSVVVRIGMGRKASFCSQ
jgi:hypothetical protein